MSTARDTNRATTGAGPGGERHPAQYLALAIGVVYTIVAIWGFFLTGFDNFAAPQGELIMGLFEVNPLHNVVHLLIGVAGLALWNTLGNARIYGWILVAAYVPTFLYGLFVANTDDPANFLALNQADNWLHAVSALAGLAIALWPAGDRARTTSTTARR